jgi:hypothetical protein
MNQFRITSSTNRHGIRFYSIYQGYKILYQNQKFSGMLKQLQMYPIIEQAFNSYIDINFPDMIIPMRGVESSASSFYC